MRRTQKHLCALDDHGGVVCCAKNSGSRRNAVVEHRRGACDAIGTFRRSSGRSLVRTQRHVANRSAGTFLNPTRKLNAVCGSRNSICARAATDMTRTSTRAAGTGLWRGGDDETTRRRGGRERGVVKCLSERVVVQRTRITGARRGQHPRRRHCDAVSIRGGGTAVTTWKF